MRSCNCGVAERTSAKRKTPMNPAATSECRAFVLPAVRRSLIGRECAPCGEAGEARSRDFHFNPPLTFPPDSNNLWRFPKAMEITPTELTGLRSEYAAHGLRRAELHSDPIKQFRGCLAAALLVA